ncbi:MAG TPA: IPT/TIG domain-containing protein [Solirubrobacteraceae bacterium]|nr:IPT/TIG domain-containing protein [Solirubrobacteraceae bacterium]
MTIVKIIKAGILVMAMLAVGAANASAVIVHLRGKTLSYQPVSGRPVLGAFAQPKGSSSSPPVAYHGGPVMPSNTNYALYWDPTGAPAYPAGYESGLNRYFEDLAHDSGGVQNTDSVLTQYKDEAGEFANYNSHFGGPLIDTDPYPANGCPSAPICFTDEQLRTEITKYVEAHKLPMDLQHEYFLLTPPGVESCFEALGHSCSDGAAHPSYCAYHGDIPGAKAVIVYANDPYVNGMNCDFGEEHPNNNPSDATIGGGLAHEHSESVTDPELNAWYDSKGREVGDKCRTFKAATEFGAPLGKAPDGSNYNQLINGDLYWYQQEWSNEAGECTQRLAQSPTVSKVTPKTGPAAGGTSVTITGTHFTGPATVKFAGLPATEVTVNSPTSITAVSPAGTAGIVDVTVTTPGGTSAINKKDHFKYKAR